MRFTIQVPGISKMDPPYGIADFRHGAAIIRDRSYALEALLKIDPQQSAAF
jgi:hypothetical protein